MSSKTKIGLVHVFAVLAVMAAGLSMLAAVAAAQEQPAPKWELYGGYSFFHPGADIHGVLPVGSSR